MKIQIELDDPDWQKFSQGLEQDDWLVLDDNFTWATVKILNQEVCDIICLHCPDWIIDND